MNPGALPPALSELFLPERSNTGERADHGGQASTDPSTEAKRFERYLSSARQSVAGQQALPTPAASEEARTARADGRGGTAERSARPDRVSSDRDDHRPVGERTVDTSERGRPVDTRDRDDAVDTTESGAKADDRPSTTSDPEAETAERSSTTESVEADDQLSGRAEAEVPAGDGAPVPASEALDLTELTDGTAPTAEVAGDEAVGPGEVAADPATIEDGESAVDGAEVDEPTSASADETPQNTPVGPRAAGAVDQATAAATAAAVASAAPERQIDPAAATSETVVDLDAAVIDETGETVDVLAAADGGVPATGAEPDAGLDPTESETGAEGGETTTGTGAEADGQGAADGGQGGDETASTDGPETVPIATPATAAAAGSGSAPAGSVNGVEGVTGPAGPRNRSTATSTQGAQPTRVPLADGEGGDPLWLQVRRAMGSLRTLQNGQQQMTIRLRPAELGSVMVRVNAGEQGTTVSLVADSAVAATQLAQQRQQLISELEQGGLAGVAVDVGTDGDTDLRDGADGDDRDANGPDVDGTGAAAVAGAGLGARTGGRGRRPGGSSGGLLDVEL